ncbi:phosphotransferase [Streptomyces avicenniae]|uniref:phosphotransferase n=1 Tax=Streptomyces avicenniae TaxID=500153 RepID=UPI00069B6A7F|nr:phosphotransferase [Streptomyces avicenniae]
MGDARGGEPLAGGMANAGAVVRHGDVVERPAQAHAPALHRHLRALAAAGFPGVPAPVALDTATGRERLTFLHGDVPLPPFPAWSMTEDVLAAVGALLRRLHDASATLPAPDTSTAWPTDLADPRGGTLLCHNDVCPENVVFRDGRPVALIDFDLAAPGRPLWDVAMAARYWAPVLDPESAASAGRAGQDPVRRLRVLADGYGLARAGREALPAVIGETVAAGRAFVARRVEAGDPVYEAAFAAYGGWARWDRVEDWCARTRGTFLRALLA